MSARPDTGKTRELGNPHDARSDSSATVSEAIEIPTDSLCRLKHCADCLRRALARDIARYFKELTGLELHLRHGDGEVPWCPEAERLRTRKQTNPQRCAICADDIWQVATREKDGVQVFEGACGRRNCWLCIRTADGCTLSLVIQTPQPELRRSSGMHCLPGAEAFHQAVTLLKLVARGLESMLEAEELRRALDQARRVQQAFLARDTRLQRVLDKHLPELSGESSLPEGTPQADRLIEQVRDFLLQNFHNPVIGLVEAAAQVHRSASYISTLFARETGVSFHSYLQELRLTKAKDLLRDPRLTVAEVAQASGYASAGWFRHSFKRHLGLSPSEWRRSHIHP
jgi:AraC-like DNA-binding protein